MAADRDQGIRTEREARPDKGLEERARPGDETFGTGTPERIAEVKPMVASAG